MFTVNTENLGNTLDYASVGGGKCYVLLIDPTVRDLGDGRTMQLASVCSSNGDKIGTANVEIRTTDMQKAEMFYVSGMLRQAVASLAPIADTLYIEPKDSCLEISDESGESMIKVPLTEKEAILEIPNSTEGAVMLRMKREEFVQAIRVGGYVAASTQMALSDAIGFKVDAENKTIKIMSFRAEMASIAITELAQVEAMGSNERPCPAVNVWHLVNYQFIQELVPKLTGEAVEIGTVSSIFKQPLHPYTNALLEAVEQLNEGTDRLKTVPGAVPQPGEKHLGCRFADRCDFAKVLCKQNHPELLLCNDGRQIRCWKGTKEYAESK